MAGAATLRAAADLLTLAGEGVAAVVLVVTDVVGAPERPREPRGIGPGELRLVTPPSTRPARRA